MNQLLETARPLAPTKSDTAHSSGTDVVAVIGNVRKRGWSAAVGGTGHDAGALWTRGERLRLNVSQRCATHVTRASAPRAATAHSSSASKR